MLCYLFMHVEFTFSFYCGMLVRIARQWARFEAFIGCGVLRRRTRREFDSTNDININELVVMMSALTSHSSTSTPTSLSPFSPPSITVQHVHPSLNHDLIAAVEVVT